MGFKHLISLGLMATVLTAPVANAATPTVQVPTAKVTLPAPMTDAELDEVEGEVGHAVVAGLWAGANEAGSQLQKNGRVENWGEVGTVALIGGGIGLVGGPVATVAKNAGATVNTVKTIENFVVGLAAFGSQTIKNHFQKP